jgi:hypothetical protein
MTRNLTSKSCPFVGHTQPSKKTFSARHSYRHSASTDREAIERPNHGLGRSQARGRDSTGWRRAEPTSTSMPSAAHPSSMSVNRAALALEGAIRPCLLRLGVVSAIYAIHTWPILVFQPRLGVPRFFRENLGRGLTGSLLKNGPHRTGESRAYPPHGGALWPEAVLAAEGRISGRPVRPRKSLLQPAPLTRGRRGGSRSR